MTGPYRDSDGKVVLTDEEYHGLIDALRVEREVGEDRRKFARDASAAYFFLCSLIVLVSGIGGWSMAADGIQFFLFKATQGATYRR